MKMMCDISFTHVTSESFLLSKTLMNVHVHDVSIHSYSLFSLQISFISPKTKSTDFKQQKNVHFFFIF